MGESKPKWSRVKKWTSKYRGQRMKIVYNDKEYDYYVNNARLGYASFLFQAKRELKIYIDGLHG
jgi:hypothetical protein